MFKSWSAILAVILQKDKKFMEKDDNFGELFYILPMNDEITFACHLMVSDLVECFTALSLSKMIALEIWHWFELIQCCFLSGEFIAVPKSKFIFFLYRSVQLAPLTFSPISLFRDEKDRGVFDLEKWNVTLFLRMARHSYYRIGWWTVLIDLW